MSVFRNAVFVAAIAGFFAGILLTVLQTYATVPLIFQAEAFENAGAPAHDHGAPADSATQPAAPAEAVPAQEAWAPTEGFERFFYTAIANVISGIGFALLLIAASEFAGGIGSWRQGVLWGLAGFAVFTLAPGLGLPPELPAMPAADLGDRQIWWTSTVVATAGGLALIAFRGTVTLSLIGLALIVAPHVVGAPQPASHDSPIPEALHHSFVVAVTVTNLIFWVALGGIAALVRTRFARESLSTRFA